MTRKPDEIKKGLEFCSIPQCGKSGENCPYERGNYVCIQYLLKDTRAYIQQLEAQNAELSGKIGQLEAERDAAVKDIEFDGACEVCKHIEKYAGEPPCNNCFHINKGKDSYFEWRGLTKEEET